ncbi:MAG: lipopolysaccharide transport periplasmic protein LptA [Burkholderiaceae bacterium]
MIASEPHSPPTAAGNARPLAILSLVAACLWLPAGAAPAADAGDKPPAGAIKIEADQMQYDDKARVNIFKGNVVLHRGDIEIRAAQLRLSQDAAGNQIARATGNPARFVQHRSGTKLTVKGQGRELRYSNKTEAVEIIGGATLLRSRPGQAPDRVKGARIVYQSNNDFFSVEGGKDGTSETNPKGRVQVVIQPRQDKKGKTPASTQLQPAKSLKTPGKPQ